MSDHELSETRSEHPEGWRISALLDEPESDPAAAAHLEACERCAAEYEQMSRTRMALSALGQLEPPADAWEGIEARLDALEAAGEVPWAAGVRAGTETPSGRGRGAPDGPFRRGARRFLDSAPLQAAAGLALFAGGVLAGLQLTAAGPGPEAGSPPVAALERGAGAEAEGLATEAGAPAEGPASSAEGEPVLGAEEWAALEELRSLMGPAAEAAAVGALEPPEAAERLARLDALILASRQALERVPADPVANGLLFELVERRNRVASELGESLHLTTVEYR